MKIGILITVLIGVLSGYALDIGSLKDKDAMAVRQEWESGKISIVASLDKNEYGSNEKINFTVTICNNSSSNIIIFLVSEFQDLELKGKDKKTKKPLLMTEKYETVVRNKAYTTSRRIREVIYPGKSYTYQAMDLRNYFKFDSEGSFSLSISGAFYQVKLEKIIHFSIDNIDFKIIDKNKRE